MITGACHFDTPPSTSVGVHVLSCGIRVLRRSTATLRVAAIAFWDAFISAELLAPISALRPHIMGRVVAAVAAKGATICKALQDVVFSVSFFLCSIQRHGVHVISCCSVPCKIHPPQEKHNTRNVTEL